MPKKAKQTIYEPPVTQNLWLSREDVRWLKGLWNRTVPLVEIEKVSVLLSGLNTNSLMYRLDNLNQKKAVIMHQVVGPGVNDIWVSFTHRNETPEEFIERHTNFLNEKFGAVELKDPKSFLVERTKTTQRLYQVVKKEAFNQTDLDGREALLKEEAEYMAQLAIDEAAFMAARKKRQTTHRKLIGVRKRLHNLHTKEANRLFAENTEHINQTIVNL